MPEALVQNVASPSFFLYGEPPRQVESRFVHLEDLDDRARPSDWTIRPHRHADLHHVFLLAAGGGDLAANAETLACKAPCIVVVPAGTVHGFSFSPESLGSVLTFADSHLRELAAREAGFAQLYAGPAWVAATEDGEVAACIARLSRELGWAAPAHAAALDAHLTSVLVEALRLFHRVRGEAHQLHNEKAALVARFRQLVESHYREMRDIEVYARRLGVSSSRLRGACRLVCAKPPTQILHDRLVLEARRIMHYSDMSVAEIGYYLGFDDPAYFSRFFTKSLGLSPRKFRADASAKQPPRSA